MSLAWYMDEMIFMGKATFASNAAYTFYSLPHGKELMILGQFFSCLAPAVLVLLQLFNNLNPGWYYIASATTGFVSFYSISLSSISDVMPKEWRGPVFGLLFAGFSLGFTLSPFFAIFLSHFVLSLVSCTILIFSLVYSIFFLPETLSPEHAREAQLQRAEYRLRESESKAHCITRSFVRPFKELSILQCLHKKIFIDFLNIDFLNPDALVTIPFFSFLFLFFA